MKLLACLCIIGVIAHPPGGDKKGQKQPTEKKFMQKTHAKPFNMTEPTFFCPKPGFELIGENCVKIDKVDVRFECPVGFTPVSTPIGPHTKCEKFVPALLRCPKGVILPGGQCGKIEITEPSVKCEKGSSQAPDKTCFKVEPIAPVQICPDGTIKHGHQCVTFEMTEPRFFCKDPEEVLEGNKCRKEIVFFKKGHKRQLEESPEFADNDAFRYELDLSNIGAEIRDELEELPRTWVPAEQTTASAYILDLTGQEAYGDWGNDGSSDDAYSSSDEGKGKHQHKVEFEENIPFSELKHMKPVTVKIPKKKVTMPSPPQEVVKVQITPAVKACDAGEKHGHNCIVKQPVEPIFKCPVKPLPDGSCGKLVPEKAVLFCEKGVLVCPPKSESQKCQCEEECIFGPPEPYCPVGTLVDKNKCRIEAPSKAYCPIGFVLDKNKKKCVRKTVEPAVCLFTVSYLCEDCDK